MEYQDDEIRSRGRRGRAWLGAARRGEAGHGMEYQDDEIRSRGRRGSARQGSARQGWARLGMEYQDHWGFIPITKRPRRPLWRW